MLNAIKSETIKLKSVVSTYVYIILMAGLTAIPGIVRAFNSPSQSIVTWSNINLTGAVVAIIALVWGAASAGGDISTRMQAHAFLTQKNRGTFLFAKSIVLFVVCAIVSVIGSLIAVAVNAIMGFDLQLGDHFRPFIMSAVGAGAMAMIGIALAMLLRSTVAAIAISIVWMLMLENLLLAVPFKWVQDLIEYMPYTAFYRSLGVFAEFGGYSYSKATIVFFVWVAVFVAIGAWCNQKRDVK